MKITLEYNDGNPVVIKNVQDQFVTDARFLSVSFKGDIGEARKFYNLDQVKTYEIEEDDIFDDDIEDENP